MIPCFRLLLNFDSSVIDMTYISTSSQSLRYDITWFIGAQKHFASKGPLFLYIYLFKVRIIQKRWGFLSMIWIQHKHFTKEYFWFIWYILTVIREIINTSRNGSIQIFGITSFEWKSTAEHCIQEYTCCPNISRRAIIFFSLNDFWTHIWWSSAKYFESRFRRAVTTKAKINKFCLLSLIYDNIF